jgi:hypothetical protein
MTSALAVPGPRFPDWSVLLTLAVLACAAVGFTFAHHGVPNNDEGFYAYASREVMRGRIPYRDFAYTQTPVLPYLQGAAMEVAGFGVRQQRWLNVAWSALALALVLAVWRRAGLPPWAGAVLLLCWFLCHSLLYYDTVGKTYALAQLLLLAAAGTLYLRVPARLKLLLLSLACVLAVGCRLTAGPAALLLWLGLGWTERPRIPVLWLVGVPLLLAVLILGPFVAADPPNALFWCLQCHLESILPRIRLQVMMESLRAAPAFVAAALIPLATQRSGFPKSGNVAGWILAAGAVGWIAGVGIPGTYSDYSVPFLPLVLLGCGCSLATASARATALACALLLAASVEGLWLEARTFVAGDYPGAVERAADYVRRSTVPTDVVLTPMPEIALGAGRDVFPGLEMGKFGLTGEMDPRTAAARHLLTWDRLLQAVDNQEPPIIVLSRYKDANFAWSFPSMRSFTGDARRTFASRLLAKYDCTYADPYFLIFERKGTKPKAFNVDPSALAE